MILSSEQINVMYTGLRINCQAFESEDAIPHLLTIISELVERSENQQRINEDLQDQIKGINIVMLQLHPMG